MRQIEFLSVSDNGIFHPDDGNEPENNKRGKYQDHVDPVQLTVLVHLMIAHQSSYMKEYTVDLHKQETGRKRQIEMRESRECACHAALKKRTQSKTQRLNET